MKKILLASAALAFATTGANAATTVYSGQDINPGGGAVATNPNADAAAANFNAQLTGTSTEGFESFATGSSAPLNLSFTGSAGALGAALSGSGQVRTNPRSSPTGSGQFAVDGDNYYFINGSNFLVNFDTDIAAFGFYAADLEVLTGIDITLNFAGGGSEVYNLATVFGNNSAASGSVHFLGFINQANPFTSVQFAGPGGDFLAFDQMTIGDVQQVTGAIPEPGTWAMMLLGFFAVGAALRSSRTGRVNTRVRYV